MIGRVIMKIRAVRYHVKFAYQDIIIRVSRYHSKGIEIP